MIHGVIVKPLRVNADDRGYLMEMLRCDDDVFERFGQAYVSLNYPGVIRAWHWHQKQSDIFVCVKGMIKVGLFDARDGSPTKGQLQEVVMGEHNPVLLKIPIGVVHGYKTIGVAPSLLVNFPTQPYDPADPDELRLPWDTPDIPFDWATKNR